MDRVDLGMRQAAHAWAVKNACKLSSQLAGEPCFVPGRLVCVCDKTRLLSDPLLKV